MSVRVMRSGPPEQRARKVVEANLHELEKPVLRAVKHRLVGGNIGLPEPDLEAAYNQAWHGVYQAIAQGREVNNLTGLLIDITYKRSVDIYRQRREAMHAADAELEDHTVEVDLTEQLDDQRKIDGLIERLVERLNTNERNAVTLCLLHGYKRGEAAERLGIPEPAFQKIMDSATKKIAGIVARMDARGCGDEEWSRALRSYALGLMDSQQPDYPRISKHIEQCASCGRYVMGLRGLAAALPPIVPIGHDAGTLLAHLHKLFAPHGAATAGAGAQTTAAVAGGATAGSTAAGGGGLSGVLGGGALKTAAVVAGLAAAGAVSIHLAGHHSAPPARANNRPSSSSPLLSSVQSSLVPPAPADSYQPADGRHAARTKHDTRQPRVARPAPSAAAAEFGFERPHRAIPRPAAAPATSARHAPARPISSESSGNGEFGFEVPPSK